MGGSRANDNDRRRVAEQITGADSIVAGQIRGRCLEAIKAWNLQIQSWHKVEPSPSVGVALNAEHFWLEVHCDGCRQVATLDLRRMNLHPLTPLANLTWRLRCRHCPGGSSGPRASLLGVRNAPPETAQRHWARKRREKLERETGLKWE